MTMKLSIKPTKFLILAFSVFLCTNLFEANCSAATNTLSTFAKSNLSDNYTGLFSQNDISSWDPCEGGVSGGVCGDTAEAIYWSVLGQYIDDPIKIAGIVGNLANEGSMCPTAWAGPITHSNGSLDNGFYYYYNGGADGRRGVGAFAITYNLSKYLHHIEDEYPDLFKYFQNPEEYNINYRTSTASPSGDGLLEKIGKDEFGKLVNAEVEYALGEFNPDTTNEYLEKDFSSPTEAATWWMQKWERPGDDTLPKRTAYAEKTYEEFKDVKCSSSSSSSNNSSNGTVSGSDITWIGDSYSVGAESEITSKFSGISFGDGVNKESSTIQSCKFVSSAGCNAPNPSGFDVLQRVIDAGELKPYLVFALGTNGGWSDSDVDRFQDMLKDEDVEVVVVTSKTPTNDFADSNNRLKAMVDANDNFHLADWVSVYNESYFSGDSERIHPVSNDGYGKWVGAIADALNNINNCTSFKGDYPQYYQSKYEDSDHENSNQDWTKIPYGSGTVASSGCGAVSMAMLATVATGEDIYPQDIIEITKSVGQYPSLPGAAHILDEIVGKKYGFEVINETYSSKTDAYDKIKKYLEDGYMIHLSGEGCHDGFANPRTNGGCTAGHFVGIFSIGSGDKVQVANSAFMGNSEVDLQSIIDSIHNGIFTAIKGKANNGSSCEDNTCSAKEGPIDGGLTEEQAQKVAHYYNTEHTPRGCCGLKNCVEFSNFFVSELTTKGTPGGYSVRGNGNFVAGNLISDGRATGGDEPEVWAVFSKTSGKHTGVVVGANSDGTYITIEAAYPRWRDGYAEGNGNGRVYTNKTFTDGTYKFAYFSDALNSTKINEILNN